MRSALAIIFAAAIGLPATALAQLPLPSLEGNGPDVRIASDDQLADEIDGFIKRVETRAKERREQISALEDRLKQARRSETPPEGIERLERSLERERELLAETIDLAKEARRSAQVVVNEPTGTIPLEDLVDQELTARRLAEEAIADRAVAERLQKIAAREPPTLSEGATIPDVLAAEEIYLQLAQAEYARARAQERSARHRLATQRANLWRTHVGVTSAQLESARSALEDAELARAKGERELTQQRRKLRETRIEVKTSDLDEDTADRLRAAARSLQRAQLEHLVRREERLEADELLAEARLVAANALAKGRRIILSPDLTGRVAARIAKVEQDRSGLEVQIATLREALDRATENRLRKILRDQRELYENDLSLLLEIRQALRVVETIEQIAEAQQAQAITRRPLVVGLSLSILVVGVVVLLLTIGTALLRRFFSAGAFARLFAHAAWPQSRAEAVAITLWPVAVLLGGAAVIIWPIWRLDLTLIEVLQLLERPLFYVEDTGVSLLSGIELLATVWIALVLSRFLRTFLQGRVYQSLKWDIGLSNAINTFVHYGVMAIAAIIGLRFVGIGASSFALVAGVLGIGIGFGLRNVTENFISGLIILAERPIKLGDFIDVGGEVQGQVQTIRARSTTVVTRDNISVIIPNSEFVGSRVTNWSHGDQKIRISVNVGVAYGSDTDLVRRQLLEVATRHGQILKKPAPEVQFRAFGDSALDFLLLVWIEEQQHKYRIASDLHFAVETAFKKVGVEIAFPQMDLHLKSVSQGIQALITGPLPIPEAESSSTMELPTARSRRSRAPAAKPDDPDR